MDFQCFILLVFILIGYKNSVAVSDPEIKTSDLVTQTVYGFLDFTTTIGSTVMVFSPQSAPSLDLSAVPTKKVDIIQTKPFTDSIKSPGIKPTKLSTNPNQNKKSTTKSTEVAQKDYSSQPDYDLLSRQPETFAEESYHVVDLVSRKRNGLKKNGGVKDPHPVGLVTTLSGKVAMDGTTTIHETSVIGTYISGKYAQVLQSSSHVLRNNHVSPSSTVRVLRTESPTSRQFNGNVGKYKTRSSIDENRIVSSTSESSSYNNIRKHGNGAKHKAKSHQKNKGSKSPRSSHRESEYVSSTASYNDARRSPFRHRPQSAAVQPASISSSATPTYSKLRSAGRWQYKTSTKPKVHIRKASDLISVISPTQTFATTSNEIQMTAVSSSISEVTAQASAPKIEKVVNNNIQAENQTSQITMYPVETLNIDIVTPSNFEDVYYEIATIKTPYTFQIGTIKKTRYITVTSTTEKSLETDYLDKSTIKGPLIENILTSTTQINQLLQGSSITTFPACTLADATETPSLDSYIETYTQSQMKLKTQVFPIVGVDKSMSYMTLVQTYGITSVITATRTTPVCIGNNNLYEFNSKLDESGSELHLDLEFADFANGDQDDGNSSISLEASSVRPPTFSEEPKKFPTEETTPSFYPQFSPEQLQQLAYLKLIQQNAQLPQLVQPTPEVMPMESLYESHVIPIIRGQQTSYKTLSKLISRTAEHPLIESQTQPTPPPFASLNPFGIQQPQFKLVTSATVVPTVLTQTLSRILKLTFGAKTALTTIFSTNVVSTAIPTFITTSLPVAPTASFGNFFPPAFPQYPFLG